LLCSVFELHYLCRLMETELSHFRNCPVAYADLEAFYAATHVAPRHKVAQLEQKGELIRLKKGLYVVSPEVSGYPLSLELIANRLYEPSYLTAESALFHYGLIPARPRIVCSISTKHMRAFENAVGRFVYFICSPEYFSLYVNEVTLCGSHCCIATPEKALCDLIVLTKYLRPRSMKQMSSFLVDELHIDISKFFKFDASIIRRIASISMKSKNILPLAELIERGTLVSL